MQANGKVKRLAAATIAVAFAVMGLKFFAWWLTGAVALYSDALESIVNVVASVAAFMATMRATCSETLASRKAWNSRMRTVAGNSAINVVLLESSFPSLLPSFLF